MPEFSEERAYLIAAADELEDYLLSRADTWRLAGPESFPPLTPGYVLFTMKRMAEVNPSGGAFGEVQIAFDKVEKVCRRWNSAWKKRVKQEIPRRLRLWSNYLDDLVLTRSQAHQEFYWNVRWRVMLTLLIAEIGDLDPEMSQWLDLLDTRLRAVSHPGPFVWDQLLESAFNRSDFWFLYLEISQS